MTTRRAFIGDVSRGAAGLTVLRARSELTRLLPASAFRGGTTAAPLLADLTGDRPAADLQRLVDPALDTAKKAGASFADIRIMQRFRLGVYVQPFPQAQLRCVVGFGMRVIANGACAFVSGIVPQESHVIEAAQNAVATAKGLAVLGAANIELAPAPVVQGTWTTPMQTDPFLVPLQDQFDLLNGFVDTQARVMGGGWDVETSVGFKWRKEYRLYGSTEGTRTTQMLYTLDADYPETWLAGKSTLFRADPAAAFLPHYGPVAGGYETVLRPNLPEEIAATAAQVYEYSRMPPRPFDVGRYPVVFDGPALGALLGKSVGQALELDRVLGYERDASGGSYLGPPEAVLGKRVINPLLQVTASRRPPQVQAVAWDDDGVQPSEYTLLKDGVVMDYHTSRQTAPALAKWYQQQGKRVESNGCALAPEAIDPVTVQMPHLTIAPAREQASFEDLCRGITRGIAVRLGTDFFPSMDQELSGGALTYALWFEINRGKIVGRVKDAGLQFQTAGLWKSLKALGGPSSVGDAALEVSKGIPWDRRLCSTTAPAGLFTDLNVVNTGLKI